MAEFKEVCKQWRRMCTDGSKDYDCCDCKMYSSIDESVCRGVPDDDEAKIIEKFVMEWAKEHPEPVYPTWGEWLESFGMVEVTKTKDRIITVMMKPELLNTIPADIAQKLGIEPKEG